MRELLRIVNELQSDNSKTGKEMIIKKYLSNKTFDYVLRFLFDDMITTGIARKKLNKLSSFPPTKFPKFVTIEELIEYVKEYNTGDDLTVKEVVSHAKYLATPNEFEDEEVTELVYSIICKDLKLGCQVSTYNKANPNNPIYVHDVMAGKSWDEERALKLIESGQYISLSEKVDGNRGTRNIKRTAIISRNGQTWDGTESILNELNQFISDLYIPDGELVYNDTTNTMTSQQIRSMTTSIMNDDKITNKAEAGIIFKIFDICEVSDFNSSDKGETYRARRLRMDSYSDIFDFQQAKYIKIIPVEFTISTKEELEQIIPRLKAFINSGHEGYMAIASNQVYKVGKGYQMMKLKDVFSGDLRICGWNYGKEKSKWEGKFASFNVEFPYVDDKGKCGIYEVAVGMGYSDFIRNEVDKDPDSYIGKILEILVTEVSSNKDGGYSLSYARMVEIRTDKNTIDLEKHSLVEIDGIEYFKKD